MSKSIHTTRQIYKKARAVSYGSRESRLSAIKPLYDDLVVKRSIKRNEKNKRKSAKVGTPIYIEQTYPYSNSRRKQKSPVILDPKSCGMD